MIILLVIAIAAVAAPVTVVLLVSLGSRREDAAFSLGRQPTGALQSAARRLLNFHADGVGRHPAGRGGTGARQGAGSGGWLDQNGMFQADDEFVDDDFAGDSDDFAGDSGDAPHLAGRR
jgi:hypothetical protein